MVKTLSPTKHETTILPDIRPKGNHPETAVVLAFMGLLDRLDEKKKAVTDEIKKANQQAMNAGLVLKDLNKARQWRAMDPQALVDEISRQKHYAMAAEVPIGTQMSLFVIPTSGDAPSQEALLALAESQGEVLGLMGNNPDYQKYHQNTDLGMAHTEGWHKGQKRVGEIFIEANDRMAKAAADKGKTKEQKEADKAEKNAAETAQRVKKEAEKKEKADAKAAEKKAAADKKRSDKEIAGIEKKAAKEAEDQKKAASKVVPIGKKKTGAGSRKH